MDQDSRKNKSQILEFCEALFRISNKIPSDFEDVSLIRVERPFWQDAKGVHVQFSVAWKLIGKSGEATEIVEKIIKNERPPYTY